MNTMRYKNYTACVEFDERDNIFIGRVLGVRSIISFHGATVAGLRREFKTAIDEFVRDCEERGVKPEKPASGKVLLRIPRMRSQSNIRKAGAPSSASDVM